MPNEYKNKSPRARVILKTEDVLSATFGSILNPAIIREMAELIYKTIEPDIVTEKGD